VKRIEIVIRPSKLEDVKKVMSLEWIAGLSVSEVEGRGRQRGPIEVYRGAAVEVEMLPRLKVEMVVPDGLVPRLLHDLLPLVRTGRSGDGKIFVTHVEEAVRIRTGERGEDAL
jgi:nitrogen regulatory protein P-II 1